MDTIGIDLHKLARRRMVCSGVTAMTSKAVRITLMPHATHSAASKAAVRPPGLAP